jgi:basic amino acid/polyamine antiporter, APA family
MLISMLACFAFAELGAMFPTAGGQYVYLREAYGEFVAFLYGWMIFTVSATGTIAALGAGFAEYMGSVFPALTADREVWSVGNLALTRGHLVAAATITLLTLVNILGLRRGAVLQNMATWAKFIAMGLFVVLGLAFGKGSWTHYSVTPSHAMSTGSLAVGVGVALIAIFWAYDGWVYITWIAGEVKNPQRNIPMALIFGIAIVGIVYVGINAVYLYALPISKIAVQPAVAHAAAISMFSASAARWLSLIIAISCFGAMATCVMTGARVCYAMAEDGVFFRKLAEVSPRWHTPVKSLVLQGIWSVLLALSGRYDQLFTYVMFMMVLSYVLTVVAVFVLRRKLPNADRPYRCAGYPWVPALYVAIGSIWTVIAFAERTKEALTGTAIVMLGVPFYFYWRRQRSSAVPPQLASLPGSSQR